MQEMGAQKEENTFDNNDQKKPMPKNTTTTTTIFWFHIFPSTQECERGATDDVNFIASKKCAVI